MLMHAAVSDLQLEHFAGIVGIDLVTGLLRQPCEGIDVRANVIHGLPGIRIDRRAYSGTLRSEQAAVRADGLDQKLKRRRRIEHGVEIQEFEPVTKARGTAATQRRRVEPAELIRDRSATVGNNDFEVGEIFEYIG